MSKRAATGLSELIASIERELAQAEPERRVWLGIAAAWCLVEQGDLGRAFELVWELAEDARPEDAQPLRLLRAELQAFCGNEDAALQLVREVPVEALLKPSIAIVRARIAAARADWGFAAQSASEATRAALVGLDTRARLVAARAQLRDGQSEAAMELLDALKEATMVDELERAALRCCCANGDTIAARLSTLAKDARRLGARRLEADIWADCSDVHLAEHRQDEAQAAAALAVEIWDEMATSLHPPLRAGFWRDVRRSFIRARSRRSSVPMKPVVNETAAAQDQASVPASGELEALLGSLRKLAAERDLDSLLEVITQGAIELVRAERGFVLLVGEDGTLEPTTVRTAEDRLGQSTAAFSRSIAETVLIDGEPVITVDAGEDSRLQDYLSVHQLMLRSVACVPIRSGARTWGVLYLEHRSLTGRFEGADLMMLRAYADQAAIAIETARLLDRVQEQQEALRASNEALLDANARLESQLHARTESLKQSESELASLRASNRKGQRWGIVGETESMRRIYATLERIALSDVPVVIVGESGTGKELVARALHQASSRAHGPFVSLSCGTIPEGLLESELFGHEAGAFTGANRARDGVFVQAKAGSLFMDELPDMHPRMQLDLLRVLQEQRVRPVGASKEVPVDARLIVASREPLADLVASGTFREDLYYRVAVVEIRLPALRERVDDIPLLCDHFLSRMAKEAGTARKRLSRAALDKLRHYDFPGNVRELEHLLMSASVFVSGDVIEAEDLSLERGASRPVPQSTVDSYQDFKSSERDRIVAALNAHDWNRAKAARSLGMARRTFYRRLKEHGIELPSNS